MCPSSRDLSHQLEEEEEANLASHLAIGHRSLSPVYARGLAMHSASPEPVYEGLHLLPRYR